MKKIIFTLTLILLSSCEKFEFLKKNKGESTSKVQGKVLLPEGSQINLSELSVQSFLGSSGIDQGSYAIDVAEDDHNFLFVSDKSDEVILMGYNYPDQTDFDINAESTVIAMAMSLPIIAYLDEGGKVDFINEIKKDRNFDLVVNKLRTMVINNISPLNTNQTEFRMLFLSLIDSVVVSGLSNARLSQIENENEPVRVMSVGGKVHFINPGKSYDTSIGIYKNGKRIEQLELPKVNFVPKSVSETYRIRENLTNRDFEGIEVVKKEYEFKEDGEYEIKIASGSILDSSPEASEARASNLASWTLQLMLAYIPLKGKADCIKDAYKQIRSNMVNYQVITEGKVQTQADANAMLYDLLKANLKNVSTSLKCFSSGSISELFINLTKKLLRFDSWVSKIATTGNTIVGFAQWKNDEPTMNLCYSKVGGKVTECGFEGLSEDIQNVVPKVVLDSLIAKGVVINRGDNPPKLDFAIIVSPFKLLTRYGPNDSYEVGRVIPDNFYRFFDQTQDNSIKYEYYSGNGTGSGTGVGSFIAGEGNSFTIFSEVRGVAGSEDYTSLNVVSGKLQNGGIADFQEAFILTYKSKSGEESRLIPVNTGRVWIDGDFISEKYDNFSNGNSRKFLTDAELSGALMK